MKKLTLVLTLVVSTLVSNAQLQKLSIPKDTKIGELKVVGYYMADLKYWVSDINGDTTYTLTFRNAKFTSIDAFETIEFEGNTETINALYELFNDAFKADDIKKYEQDITLGKYQLKIKGYKTMGIKGVQFYAVHPSGVISYINPFTEGQLKNLFGK